MTGKQRAFIDAYFLHNFSATKAAQVAGYADPTESGYQTKKAPEVAAEISRRMEELAMPANEVLIRLGRQARANIFDVLELDEYTQKPIMNLSHAKEHGMGDLIKEVGYNERGNLEIKLHDAQSALVHLGRHHKLFTDKTEHSGKVTVEQKRDLTQLTPEELNELERISSKTVIDSEPG